MRLFPTTALLVLAFTVLVGTAKAQMYEEEDPSTTDTAPAPKDRQGLHYYGWQTLLVDGASFSTMFAAIPLESGPVAIAGLAGYAFGGPIVHAAHGQWGHAFGSFALRAGLPTAAGLTGFAVGAAACPHDTHAFIDACPLGLVGLGVAIGAVVAPFLDANLLGYESVNDAKGVSIAPSIAVDRNGAAFAVRGRF
jgi:hypothetical protein